MKNLLLLNNLLGIIVALGILIQDLEQRRIHILLIILWALFGLIEAFIEALNRWDFFFIRLVMPCALILITVVVMLFFWASKKGLTTLFDKIGWGDIISVWVIAVWIDAELFTVFWTTVNVLTALVALALIKFRFIGPSYPIPYAGILAGSFI